MDQYDDLNSKLENTLKRFMDFSDRSAEVFKDFNKRFQASMDRPVIIGKNTEDKAKLYSSLEDRIKRLEAAVFK